MFELTQSYRRSDIHSRFGGQQQGGISTPRDHAMVLLFSSDSGEQFGYNDGWNNDGTYRYSGEGQVGDMTFQRGNLAIRDHAANGKALHLFEKFTKGWVRYVGQMKYVSHELVPNVPDRHGRPRVAIVFRLARS